MHPEDSRGFHCAERETLLSITKMLHWYRNSCSCSRNNVFGRKLFKRLVQLQRRFSCAGFFSAVVFAILEVFLPFLHPVIKSQWSTFSLTFYAFSLHNQVICPDTVFWLTIIWVLWWWKRLTFCHQYNHTIISHNAVCLCPLIAICMCD